MYRTGEGNIAACRGVCWFGLVLVGIDYFGWSQWSQAMDHSGDLSIMRQLGR